jgi:DNA-binding beta-propeller fold protein YncE
LYFANDGNTTADRVYGQAGNFTTNAANMDAAQPSADSLFSPRAVALDAAGGLYIADSSNNRILYFAPDGDTTADWVYGQAGAFNTSASGSSVDMLNAPQGVSVAPDGRVYIADTGNNRVLVLPR